MNKTNNSAIKYWTSGHLYTLVALALFLWYALNDNVGVMDWYKDSAYLHYIKISLTEFDTLPYFWWSKIVRIAWIPPIQATSTFISIPETTLFSPLTPLLYFLSEIVYLKLYVFIQCLVGLSGVFALRKQLHWNDLQFRTYFAIFIFSPIVFQHIAIGYFPWYNIFFFPWLIFFLIKKRVLVSIVGMSSILGVVLLQGGVYVFLWFVMILLFYGFYNIITEREYKKILHIAGAIVLVSFLAYARIYTASISFADFSREWFEVNGYNPLNFLFFALIPTVTVQPLDLIFWTNLIWLGIPQHDAGLFWGLVVVLVAVLIIKYKEIFKQEHANDSLINYKALLFTAVTIFIFSFFTVWVTITRTIQLFVDLPFFESIKNYGYRLGIPAYLGFTLVAANYIERIWAILLRFLQKIPWLILKKLTKTLFVISSVCSGGVYFLLAVFSNQFNSAMREVITAAYNNTGNLWLRNRMEGMAENDLRFYFIRFENLFSILLKVLLIIFILLFFVYLVSLIVELYRSSVEKTYKKFPYIKLELALVLPLIFSTSMWINLATRTEYDSRPKQEVDPPALTVISEQSYDQPILEATPRGLTIKQLDNTGVEGYLFPDIKAQERNNLEVVSKNGVLVESNGRLMVRPSDDQPIMVEFMAKKVNRAILITALAWAGVIIFLIINGMQRIHHRLKTGV